MVIRIIEVIEVARVRAVGQGLHVFVRGRGMSQNDPRYLKRQDNGRREGENPIKWFFVGLLIEKVEIRR